MTDKTCHKVDTNSPECMSIHLTALRRLMEDKGRSRMHPIIPITGKINHNKIQITMEEAVSLSQPRNASSHMEPNSLSSRTVVNTRQRLMTDKRHSHNNQLLTVDSHLENSNHNRHRTVVNRPENNNNRHSQHHMVDNRPATRTNTHNRTSRRSRAV